MTVTCEKHGVYGSWMLSAMLPDGYSMRRRYYGYTRKEALAEFRHELRKERAKAKGRG